MFKSLMLEVIPNNESDKTLSNFYKNSYAIGTEILYNKKITSNYSNKNHEYCMNSLNKQPVYQLNTQLRHIVNITILSSSWGKRLTIYLISVESLSEYNR